jgi:hypothetical protein
MFCPFALFSSTLFALVMSCEHLPLSSGAAERRSAQPLHKSDSLALHASQ